MTIHWGSWNSTTRLRTGIEVIQSPATVDTNTASVTYTIRCYLQTYYASNETGSSTDWWIYGASSNSGNTDWNLPAMGYKLMGTDTLVVNLTYGSTNSRTWAAKTHSYYAYPGVETTASLTVTVPARPYATPAAPSGVSAARVSDTQQTVSWTNNATTAAPYTSIKVERSTDGGSYAEIASLSGSSTSLADATTSANHEYRYRVRAYNGSGYSGYGYSGYLDTTPSAPSAPSASKTSVGDIAVSWPAYSSRPATQLEVWHAADGVWDASALATLAETATSYTHTAPNTAQTHSYRLRGVSDGPVLSSAYSSASNTVQLLAAPNAPSGLTPNGDAADMDASVTFAWTHNPVDTTAQTAYEIQARPVGGSNWQTFGNMVENGSAENGTTGWATASVSIVADSSQAKYGSTSIKATTTAASVDAQVRYGSSGLNGLPVVPGQTITLGYWIYETSVTTVGCGFYGYDSAGSSIGNSLTTNAAVTLNTWTQVVESFVVPAGCFYILPFVGRSSARASGATFWVDGLVVKAGASNGVWDTDYSRGSKITRPEEHHSGTQLLPNGQDYEWQVRTWGSYASPSPWSATAVVTASSAPTATVNTPDGVTPVSTSTVTVDWGYYQAEGSAQAQWRAVLYDAAGTILETLSGNDAATTATFATTVSDGGNYQVGVSLRSAAGLWSVEDVVAFTVSYALPPVPTFTLLWLPDSGSVAVTATTPAPGAGEVAADHLRLFRSIGSGGWALVADLIDPQGSVTDYIPALETTNHYKLVAVSATPSTSESATQDILTTGSGGVFVNAGQGFAQTVVFRHGVTLGKSPGRAKALEQYAGREWPLEYAGEQRSYTLRLSAALFRPDATPAVESSLWSAVEALADLPAPVCIRDLEGTRLFVSSGSPDIDGVGVSPSRPLRWLFERVDWTEPTT